MSDVRARRGAAEMLRTIALSSRPLSWVNTAFPFAAAYLTVTRELDLTAILGTLYFLIPYNLAMYGINDVFDYESDMRNPRKAGVEGAVLARAMHRPVLVAVLVTNVPFLVYLVAVGSAASVAVLAVSVFAVIAYSLKGLRFKERPILDSLTSSTHFTSPAVYGIVLAGGAFTPALWAILVAFVLWGVASHAFGAVLRSWPTGRAASPPSRPCWAVPSPCGSPCSRTPRRASRCCSRGCRGSSRPRS